MKERPILFSAPMVRAILEGRKTQTRRVVKPQPTYAHKHRGIILEGTRRDQGKHLFSTTAPVMLDAIYINCPYGQVGDQLWVREAWNSNGFNWGKPIREMHKGLGRVHYAATNKGDWKDYWGGWKPSIHMPRWASRIQLEITDIRVERLQDISEADAKAEGVEFEWDGRVPEYTEKSAFRDLWKSINGAESWDQNPWVWVISFKRV